MRKYAIILLTCVLWFGHAQAQTSPSFKPTVVDSAETVTDSAITGIKIATAVWDSIRVGYTGGSSPWVAASADSIYRVFAVGDTLWMAADTVNDTIYIWASHGNLVLGSDGQLSVFDSVVINNYLEFARVGNLHLDSATYDSIFNQTGRFAGGTPSDTFASNLEFFTQWLDGGDFDSTNVAGDTNVTVVHSRDADSLGHTFAISNDSALIGPNGDTIAVLQADGSWFFGNIGLTSSDSALIYLLYLKAGVAPADSTFFLSTQAVSAGEHCLYYVSVADGPDSAYWGSCTGGAGVSEATLGDSLANYFDTAAVADTIQGMMDAAGLAYAQDIPDSLASYFDTAATVDTILSTIAVTQAPDVDTAGTDIATALGTRAALFGALFTGHIAATGFYIGGDSTVADSALYSKHYIDSLLSLFADDSTNWNTAFGWGDWSTTVGKITDDTTAFHAATDSVTSWQDTIPAVAKDIDTTNSAALAQYVSDHAGGAGGIFNDSTTYYVNPTARDFEFKIAGSDDRFKFIDSCFYFGDYVIFCLDDAGNGQFGPPGKGHADSMTIDSVDITQGLFGGQFVDDADSILSKVEADAAYDVKDTVDGDVFAAHYWANTFGYLAASDPNVDTAAWNSAAGGGWNSLADLWPYVDGNAFDSGAGTMTLQDTAVLSEGEAADGYLGISAQASDVDTAGTDIAAALADRADKIAQDSVAAWDNRGYPLATGAAKGIASFSTSHFLVESGIVTICTDCIGANEVSGLTTSDLSANAGIVFTQIAASASSDLTGRLSDEQGTGGIVCASGPTITSPIFSTSAQLPSGTNPVVDAIGEIAYETDDTCFRVYDGTVNRAIPIAHIFSVTIDNPDALTKDTVMILPVRADVWPFGIELLSVGIKTWAATTYSVEFQTFTEPGDGGIESSIEVVATSSSREAEDDGTLTTSTISSGSIIVAILPATDIDQVTLWGTYYVKTGD